MIAPAQIAGRGVSALCLAGAAAALHLAAGEWRVQTIAAAMTAGGDARAAVLDAYLDVPVASLPPRARAGLAQLALTQRAGTADPGLRQLCLERAAALVAGLRAERPDWAPALLLDAELELARRGGTSDRALADYAASYRAAPFLWQESRWRIAFGAANWARLGGESRARMIDEAVWVATFDGGQRAGIEQLLGDSPAAIAFELRLAANDTGG